MIGAEPPQLQHREPPRLGRRRARGARPARSPRTTTFGVALDGIVVRRARRRDRRHRRRLGQRPAGADGGALRRGHARAARQRSRSSARTWRGPRRACGARAGPALRARGAPRPRRGADAVAGAEHAADAHRARSAPAAGCASAPSRALARDADPHASTSRPAARTRRRRACRAATCRSSSSAARSTPAPKLLIVSQPTWGVDVGAAAQIRGELLALRDAGCAVLVVSEELDELFEICDRLVVIARGRVSPRVPTARGDGRADRRVDERAVAGLACDRRARAHA